MAEQVTASNTNNGGGQYQMDRLRRHHSSVAVCYNFIARCCQSHSTCTSDEDSPEWIGHSLTSKIYWKQIHTIDIFPCWYFFHQVEIEFLYMRNSRQKWHNIFCLNWIGLNIKIMPIAFSSPLASVRSMQLSSLLNSYKKNMNRERTQRANILKRNDLV